jgi:leucyl aminopeptidase
MLGAESTFENSNKNIHSANESASLFMSLITTNSCAICSRIDISDEFSFSHMLEFSKLAAAFAIELGGWTKSD